MVDTEHPRTDTLYAKSDPLILFDPHSGAVADATVAALDSPAAARATHPARIPLDRLRTLAGLAGLLHDTGKLHPDWQADCRQAIATGESGRLPFHSSRSALIAFHLTRSSDGIPDLDAPLSSVERMAIILSILHHHTQISERNQRPDAGLIAPTDIDDLLDPLGRTETFDEWTLPRDTAGSVQQFRQAIERVRELSKGSERFRRIASLTTVLRSALIQADHHASSKPDDGPDAPLPTSLTEDTLTFYDELRPFQQAVADRLTASAPCSRLCGLADCGAGKTQTALQWGDAQRQAGAADRLVIAMPTRTTSNNLFHAITSDHTDPSDVALHHSTSDRIYSEAFGDERDLATVNAYPRRCKWLQKPITICTVDHLLATLVNNDKHSDIARGNLRRAAVVFDEIHAYDRHLLKQITGAVEHLDANDIPWYIMTATCPPAVHEALDPSETVRDPRSKHAPYRIEHHDTDLTAATVADSFAESGARTAMVVKNTVRGAQHLAQRLHERTPSDVSITYYSSEFPSYDRCAKEREVREQFVPGDVPPDERRILVCTQVCELSLDISVDRLYTDLAPIDAVIQRAGRLHRHGIRPDTRSCRCSDCADHEAPLDYVCHTYFDTTEGAWYPYATDEGTPEWRLLLATRDVLDAATTYSFENAQRWIEAIYSEYDFNLAENTFHKDALGDSLFGPPRWDTGPIEFRSQMHRRLQIVASEYHLHDTETASVSFRDLLRTADPHENHGALYDAIEDYSIQIPAYWLSSDDVSCRSKPALPEAPRVSPQEVTLSYSYQWGIDDPLSGSDPP